MSHKYLDQFMGYMVAERGASKYTLRSYRIQLEKWYRFIDNNLLSANREHGRAYLAVLRKGGMTEPSVKTVFGVIRSFYSFLHTEGVIAANDIANIHIRVKHIRVPRTIKADILERLFNAPCTENAIGRRNRAILEVLYATGMRVGELCSLRIDDLDFGTGEIRVIGKGDKERVIPFVGPVQRYVSEWLEKGRHKYAKKESPVPNVFITIAGTPATEDGIRRVIEKYLKQIGETSDVTPHKFRHTVATALLNGEMDLRTLQEILGHADISTTTIYTHVSKDRAKASYMKAHPRFQASEE